MNSASAARQNYRATIGRIATEATYVTTRFQGLVAIYRENPRSLLEPHARAILEEIVRSSRTITDLRDAGLNGYDWEYELLKTIRAEEQQKAVVDLDNAPISHMVFKPIQCDSE